MFKQSSYVGCYFFEWTYFPFIFWGIKGETKQGELKEHGDLTVRLLSPTNPVFKWKQNEGTLYNAQNLSWSLLLTMDILFCQN